MGCVYIAARCSWPQGWQPQSCKESKGWKVGVGTEGCAEKEIGTERSEECEEEIKSALSFTGGPIKSDAQPLSVSIFVSVLAFVEPFHLSTGVQPQDSPDLGGVYKGKGQSKHLKFLSWDFEAAHVNCMKVKLIVDITVVQRLTRSPHSCMSTCSFLCSVCKPFLCLHGFSPGTPATS